MRISGTCLGLAVVVVVVGGGSGCGSSQDAGSASSDGAGGDPGRGSTTRSSTEASSTSHATSSHASTGATATATGAGGGLGGGGADGGGGGASAGGGGAGGATCVDVDDGGPLLIATAQVAGEYALALPATSASHTRWSEVGNEALVLDVTNDHGSIGQMVLHQGADGFTYDMAIGHLDAGERVSVRVSPLSAPNATRKACVGPAKITEAAALGVGGEGLIHAPIFKWPVKKSFDDLPVMLGWTKAGKAYEAYYTNENGGTVAQCGGGADGMQAELARWGRGCDIERMYNYGANPPTWERCTGSTSTTAHAIAYEGEHPIVYYGDGHNRLFESRGGYGDGCGTGSDAKADGDITGWNSQNPGNAQAEDAGFVITLRPLPVALDPLGYPKASGRREGAVDTYAPWLYRVIGSELTRENKVDGTKVQPMQSYLYVDVHANDVGGSGDSVCSTLGAKSGFKLRIGLAGGAIVDSVQMTADYFGGQDNVKRMAIAMGQELQAADVRSITLDAFDDDGIYWLDLGDAFIPQISGDNGATLAVVHAGSTPIDRYVDDDNSNCPGGMNPDGPSPPYPCAGSAYKFVLP